MLELIPANTHFDFMGKAKYAAGLSLVLLVAAVYLWFLRGETKYGVDFMGGLEVITQIKEGDQGSEHLRKSLEAAGLNNVVVQPFEAASHEYAIRMRGAEVDSKSATATIRDSLSKTYAGKADVLSTNYVGPTVGAELRRQAVIALIISLLGVMLYIAYRFEFAFALGAVVALFHDVGVCIGVFLLLDYDFSMTAVAALLTVVGYSVNDTIVIFDRVREEIFKRKEFELIEVMNESNNYCLGRTIITGTLTFFSALALFFFGGGAIRDLSLILVVGCVTGMYSTIYIASPVTLAWVKFRNP